MYRENSSVLTKKLRSYNECCVIYIVQFYLYILLTEFSSGLTKRLRKKVILWGYPSGSDGKESTCQCRRPRFNPWVGKIPCRKKWQPTLIFLPGKPHQQRTLVGYSPWGCKESDTTEQLTYYLGGGRVQYIKRLNAPWRLFCLFPPPVLHCQFITSLLKHLLHQIQGNLLFCFSPLALVL